MADDYSVEMEDEPIEGEVVEPQIAPAQRLLGLINAPNIAVHLDKDTLAEIASRVVEEYRIDDESRADWKAAMEEAVKLSMLVAEQKDYPFEKAANVKYPLLTTAALQFSARAYPAIVPGDRIVKCKVNGKDPQGLKAARGDRVSEYTSWQLTDEMPEWEPDTDKLLVILPIVGCAFRKRYYDPALGRQCSRLVTSDRLVVNYHARSLEDAPRITEELTLYPNEIQERILDGRFIEFDYSATPSPTDDDEQATEEDRDAPHLFLEQHRLWDLDGDGYPEPYIATVHKGSEQVCRIVANYSVDTVRMSEDGSKVIAIRKRDFYVKYGFLPSPDGGFYELGFGWLLKSSNEAINTTLNEMLDAGHLANVQGGFVSSALSIREKEFKIKMGTWKVLNASGPINQAIMPVTYPGPSDTLFKLLGLLVEMGKEVAAIKDVLSGEVKQNMQPTTVLALIEQGMQFFTAIYKRIHRSLKAELAIHSRLNFENLEPEAYNSFFDDQTQYDPKVDFNGADKDISPASDPSVSSRMQRLAKAEFILASSRLPNGEPDPLINQEEVKRRYFAAADIEDLDKLIVPPQPPDPAQVELMQRGAVAEVRVKEALAEKQEAETALALGKADDEANAVEPVPQQVEDPMVKALEVEALHLKNEGLRIANQNATADLKTKDVDVKEDGTVESKTESGFKGMAEMIGKLAELIVQQGDATRKDSQQGNEALLKVMMAPNVLIRDENGRAQASRKEMN